MKKYLAAAALVVFASPVFAQSGMVANPTSSNEYVAAHVCVLLGLKGTDLVKCEESQAAGTAVDAPSGFEPKVAQKPEFPRAIEGSCAVSQPPTVAPAFSGWGDLLFWLSASAKARIWAKSL